MEVTPPPRRPGHGRSPWARLIRFSGAMRRARLYEELATLLNAGIGVRTAIASLETQAPRGTEHLVAAWMASVAQGAPLWQAMERHPEAFSPLEISLVRIGERSGRLVDALRGLASRLETERRTRLTALGAVAYPVTVIHVALFLPTIPLIGVPYGAGAYFMTVIVGLTVVWGVPLVLTGLYSARRLKPSFSRRVCNLPIVGAALHSSAVQRFAWTLGLLHDAGERSDTALREAAVAADCGWFLSGLDRAVGHVTEGNSLAEAIRFIPAIPRDVCQMIENGERSGSLAESMKRAGEIYDERASRSAKAAAVALGAVTFGIAVLIVIVAVLGVMVPYFRTLYELSG
jgi:type II secretory pathway component PulF